MKKSVVRGVVSLLVIVVLIGAGKAVNKPEHSVRKFTCSMTVSPSSMAFGLRGEADTQYLNITSPSYWEVYAGGWITVNGQVSYISHGNAAVAITVVNPPVPPGWNGTSTYTDTGTIHVQDYTSGCSDFIITITYTVCPSC